MKVVAYVIAHNEGIESGYLANISDTVDIADLYECDIVMSTCSSVDEAKKWIDKTLANIH